MQAAVGGLMVEAHIKSSENQFQRRRSAEVDQGMLWGEHLCKEQKKQN